MTTEYVFSEPFNAFCEGKKQSAKQFMLCSKHKSDTCHDS